MAVRVRRAVDDDRMNIFKLCAQMHAESDFRHFKFDPEKCIHSLGLWIEGGLLLVAERDLEAGQAHDLVGMFGASKKNPSFSTDVVVAEDCFYVRPDARGSRAAFMLMRGFLDWAEELKAHHVRAGVATDTGPAAERLYEHFGMRYVGGNYSLHISRSEP